MNRNKIHISIFLVINILAISSCEKEGEENAIKISSYNGSKSHNMGQNCMDCHKQGGQGEGWFNIAGTVYDNLQVNTYPNATVRLYTGPGGTGELKYTVQVDGLGNFYSTETINFETGLYMSVQGDVLSKYMSSSINTGQCNSCHGSSTDKIWTE